MDRKTLLAVVISVVIIVAGMVITPLLSPPKPVPAARGTSQQAPRTGPTAACRRLPGADRRHNGQAAAPAAGRRSRERSPAAAVPGKVVGDAGFRSPRVAGRHVRHGPTDLYTSPLRPTGATLISVKLKKFKNLDRSPVDMLHAAPGPGRRTRCRSRCRSGTTQPSRSPCPSP